jgi:hypothetical protein
MVSDSQTRLQSKINILLEAKEKKRIEDEKFAKEREESYMYLPEKGREGVHLFRERQKYREFCCLWNSL